MDETAHHNLMRLSSTSRVATADVSELVREPGPGAQNARALPLSDMLEMGLEALLSQFRRR